MEELDRKISPKISHIENLSVDPLRSLTLDNGIILNVINRGQDEVNRLVAVRPGGIAEAGKMGIASLTAELMREGAGDLSGASLAEIIDYNGSWMQTIAHAHHISLAMSSLNSRFEYVAGIMAEIWEKPLFPESAFEVQREVEACKIEQAKKKVSYLSSTRLNQLCMGESHPLALIGIPEEIRGLSVEEIKSFFSTVKALCPTVLYLSGKITSKIEEQINHSFGKLPILNSTIPFLNKRPFEPVTSPYFERIIKDDTPESAISIAIPAIPRSNPDYINLRIAVVALGGYFGSRLVSNIREEKGYTYGIRANLEGYLDGGIIKIESQCDNKFVTSVIEEIESEIQGMSQKPLNKEELIRLKQYLTTSLLSVIQTPFTSMDYYVNQLLVGTPEDYFQLQLQAINSLTPEKITEISAKYLQPEKMITVVAGK